MKTDRQKEAERLYCRLMSSDPDFNDCTDAANFIRETAIELKGPDGFETWKDAAVSERLRRVSAEAELKALVDQHEAQEPFGPIVAYASSSEFRRNQLLSKAQYDNCLPKNRVDFDIPLVAVSKCDMCNDNGSVGFPPDDYYPCPKCTPPTLAATQEGDASRVAQEGGAWISVQDRLPDEETDVIALRFGNPCIAAIFVEIESYDNSEYGDRLLRYWDDPTDDGQGWGWDEITHWMPLPPAPTTTRSE